MNFQELIGYFAGTLTTIAFLPQVIKVYKTKSAKDISLMMMILFIIGVMSWVVYGFMSHGMPVLIANIVTFILTLWIIIMKLYYHYRK